MPPARPRRSFKLALHVADRVVHLQDDVLLERLQLEQRLIGVQARNMVVGARGAVAQWKGKRNTHTPRRVITASIAVYIAIEIPTGAI